MKIYKYFDIKLFFTAIISALIHSFAICNFSIPAKLYPTGFSGICRLVSDLSFEFLNISISYSILYFSLNIVATIFVFNKLGKKFAIYSVFQFIFVSIFTSIFKPVVILDETLLMAVFGGIINGCGIGLALYNNFSSGGFDFISVYFSNKYKKSVWNYILFVNCFILIVSGFVFGWERSLYSIIFQFCSTNVVKMLHNRYTHKTLTIITKYPNEVSDNILKNVRHGITEIKATGYFSKQDEEILYTVVNSFQYKDVINAVMDVDPKAFINVQETIAVYGNYYQKPLD